MRKSDLDFKDKTAVVTGSTRGIGKSIADLLGEHGCHVVRTGTKSDSVLDLADDASVKAFLAGLEKLEAVDILVNNAGINFVEPIDAISEDQWQKIMKVNLTGAMLLMKTVSKMMIAAARGGKILNVSSIFGLISRAGRDSYSSSKAGLLGLTRAAAIDLAPHNILVNALCPGFTLTDLTQSMLSREEMKALSEEIPMKRMAQESEIANAALFLCSDLNTYMTGQILVADGGYVIA